MKLSKLITLLITFTFISCEQKSTLCDEEQTKDALVLGLVESVSSQAKYIEEEYGIDNVESKLIALFDAHIQLEKIDFQGELPGKNADQTCTCRASVSFSNKDQFIDFIKPIVLRQKDNADHYSSEYLKAKHLIDFYDKGYYSFFFVVTKNEFGRSADLLDYKVGTLLLDYLKFSESL